jgi:hypothetical protein
MKNSYEENACASASLFSVSETLAKVSIGTRTSVEDRQQTKQSISLCFFVFFFLSPF